MTKAKTVLFLSPHFPASFPNFIVALKNAGCTTLAIGDCPFDSLCDLLKNNIDQYHEVPCMENYDEVYRAIGYMIYNHGRIDWVQSHNEHWLFLEAKIREDFNIQDGYQPSDLDKLRRKSAMKHIFKGLGLKVARGRVMSTKDEVLDFIHNPQSGVGYPIVAKPDIGVGAINTFCLNDDSELENFFNTCFIEHPQDYIFEEFIAGKLVTFDGLASKDSKILFHGSMHFAKGLLETVTQQDSDGVHAYASRDISPYLIKVGQRLVEAFQVRGHFFHFEFFHTPEGEYVILEANLRLPGGRAIDLYNYAYDADFFQLWADVVADKIEAICDWNRRFSEESYPSYYVCYASRCSRQHYVFSNDEIAGPAFCTQEIPQTDNDIQVLLAADVPNYCRANMGDFAFIFRVKQQEPMVKMLKNICMKEASSCCAF